MTKSDDHSDALDRKAQRILPLVKVVSLAQELGQAAPYEAVWADEPATEAVEGGNRKCKR